MGYSLKILVFLLLSNVLSISTATRTIEPEYCGSCSEPPVIPVVPLPPVTTPKLPVPPVTVPKVPVPPVTVIVPPITVPNVPVPPVTGIIPPVVPIVPVVGVVPLPPVTLPPIVGVLPLPPVTLPPVSIPTLPLPPVVTTPKNGKPCPPHEDKKATCRLNTLKLGACAGLLGGTASIGAGDSAVNKCCPIISGLADAEAAACLCTTLKKLKTLDLKMYVPVAHQLLVTCGKTPPPGYTCAV